MLPADAEQVAVFFRDVGEISQQMEKVVITLLELEEKSVRETAELTGWSESNVKVRAFRARKKMKAIFEKLGLER